MLPPMQKLPDTPFCSTRETRTVSARRCKPLTQPHNYGWWGVGRDLERRFVLAEPRISGLPCTGSLPKAGLRRQHRRGDPLGRHRLRYRRLLVRRQPDAAYGPCRRLESPPQSQHRLDLRRQRPPNLWMHQNGAPFFGVARESDEGDAGVQGIGSGVVEVMPGDYFELIARQTSGATKDVAANELTWFAIEVVE
jgi:hypothetical protein